MSRRDLLKRIATDCGPVAEVVEARDGWPGLLRIKGASESFTVAAHVGPVGLGHRGRDDVERRFQNPGQRRPVQQIAGMDSLLLGLWEEPESGHQPVLVGMEVTPHRLQALTRQSYFVPLEALREAQATGWAEHTSGSEEEIVIFHPALLPVYAEIRGAGLRLPGQEISAIGRAAGLGDLGIELSAEERARRAAQVLIRSGTFSRNVIGAYKGLCAMCGLNFGLLEGAHILPARVSGSPDEVWNGLALCRNHHGAFDRHKIWIHPAERKIRLHPDILQHAETNDACRAFIEFTDRKLRPPTSARDTPAAEMFERRYSYFLDAYDWAQ